MCALDVMALWETADSSSEGASSRIEHGGPLGCQPQKQVSRLEGAARFEFQKDDYTSAAWWTRPIHEATAMLRESKGEQCRPLRIGTACSGTEAPCLALKACGLSLSGGATT